MRTALYLRVSLDKSGDGLGIERQREDCRRLAEQRGWTVTSEIVENNTSATYGPRPGFEKLLQLMEGRQIDAVIVWHVDRLLRKMTDLERVIELVEASNVRVATVSGEIDLGTDMGRMVGRIMASVARAEVERKSARHKRANLQKAQAGKPHGSKRAYGYEADLITIKEDEAAILREMARRVMNGHSYKEVSFWASAQGYRTTTGKIFYPLTVRNLLHKKRYAGIREYNGAEYPAIWEPVFDAETWERLQLVIRLRHDRNGYEQGPPKARKYLLTGLVYCGRCGWPLSGSRMYDAKDKTPRRVYFCSKRTDQLAPSGCNGLRRNADALEHWIAECLFYRLDSPELGELLVELPKMREIWRGCSKLAPLWSTGSAALLMTTPAAYSRAWSLSTRDPPPKRFRNGYSVNPSRSDCAGKLGKRASPWSGNEAYSSWSLVKSLSNRVAQSRSM
jgi:site-specific DNA recombinase